MAPRFTFCDGCCCGRVEKGNHETPVEYLRETWKKHELNDHVKLTISGCLGPCRMNNVSLITTGTERIWLGEINEIGYYESIVELAIEIANGTDQITLPENLAKLRFDPSA